jgi:hypothetical protein
LAKYDSSSPAFQALSCLPTKARTCASLNAAPHAGAAARIAAADSRPNRRWDFRAKRALFATGRQIGFPDYLAASDEHVTRDRQR